MKRTQAIELPEEEIAKQKEWMAEFAALEDRPHTYCVVTYGCQMNAHDSEKLEGMLAEMGMTPAASREEADFVIFNTCCVRSIINSIIIVIFFFIEHIPYTFS